MARRLLFKDMAYTANVEKALKLDGVDPNSIKVVAREITQSLVNKNIPKEELTGLTMDERADKLRGNKTVHIYEIYDDVSIDFLATKMILEADGSSYDFHTRGINDADHQNWSHFRDGETIFSNNGSAATNYKDLAECDK